MQPTMQQEHHRLEGAEHSHVSLTDEREAVYWMRRFDASRTQIEDAIDDVGDSVTKVQAWLEQYR